MIGAAVFVIFFFFFTLISLAVDLPPGIWTHDWFNIQTSEYSSLINGIVNGIFYGLVIWIVFCLAKIGRDEEASKTKPSLLEREARELLDEGKSREPKKLKRPKELTEIRGIGPIRAEELKAAGVTTVYDLAKRSAKHLSKKTGIPIRNISEWIVEANRMIE